MKRFLAGFGGAAFVAILVLFEIQIAAPIMGYSPNMRIIIPMFVLMVIAMLVSIGFYPL